jgi:hypothetical protein|tara:strand:- start:697 stop:942 length:246 start_codon:yes stop_codon:yes gene_type:complete
MPIVTLPVETKRTVVRSRLSSERFGFFDFTDSPPEILGRPTPEPVLIEQGLSVGQLLKAAEMLRTEAARRDKHESKTSRQT